MINNFITVNKEKIMENFSFFDPVTGADFICTAGFPESSDLEYTLTHFDPNQNPENNEFDVNSNPMILLRTYGINIS